MRVSKKLRNEEALITEYSGVRLRMDLDRVPLWRGDHVTLKQLWSDYSQYLYLPRLVNSEVLLGAVRSGVALLTWDPDSFAYASAFAEATNRYSGLVGGQHAGVVLDATSMLVKPDIAARQIAEDVKSVGGEAARATQTGDRATTTPPGPDQHPTPGHGLSKRFCGRAALEPVRMLRDLGEIAEAIVGQLDRAGANVTISVEIEATTEGGFPDDVRRIVTST